MARPKGAKNKNNPSFNADEIIAKYDMDPLDVLMMVAVNDWKGLGFDAPTKISYTSAGIEFEEPNISLSNRVSAAKEVSKYKHAAKQAVALSTGAEGIKIEITDYSSMPSVKKNA